MGVSTLEITRYDNLKMVQFSRTIFDCLFSGAILKAPLLFFLLLLCFSISFSQDFKKNYRKAKDLFQNGKYSEAMDAFNALSVYDKNNPYTEYAQFFYGLSAYKLGFNTLAKNQWLKLKKSYPHWNQLDEVNYWLATLYFQQADPFQGMKMLATIRDNSFRSSLDSLKHISLSKIEDVELLKMLLEDNPTDVEVARSLAVAIGKKDFPNSDLPLLDSLVLAHSWNREEFVLIPTDQLKRKDRYRISLLFPFRMASLEPTPERKKNQAVLDLYQGMRLAVDSLSKSGVPIDLVAYDTDRNIETTKSILSEPELKFSDLIIGPLFADEAKWVQQFSKENKINLFVNPVSNNSDFLRDNNNAFLFQPSHETIGKKSAEWMATHLKKKNCIVYYGDNPKDSVIAFNFIKRALSLGIHVKFVEEVRKETSTRILETLAKATEYDERNVPKQFKLRRDSLGGVFVASDSPLIYTKVVNSVETRGDSVLVVGQESWLDDNSLDYSKIEKNKIVLAAPNFMQATSPAYHRFRKAYVDKHGLLPSDNAKIGFEMVFVIGQAMRQYGHHFQHGLIGRSQPFGGMLTEGYSLQPTRDNGLIPFVTFRRGVLTPVP
jgi:ABC-type branched-subunit amino acid transport system substrate-binding protein